MALTTLYKYIFGVMLLMALSYGGYAQNLRPNQPQRKLQQKNFAPPAAKVAAPQNIGLSKIQGVKEAFLKEELALTKDQDTHFWPVYRKYQAELHEIRRLKRLNNSDAQANGAEQVKKDMDYDAQLVNIRKHYNEEFLKILPSEKVSQLLKSERAFNDELLRKLHNEKQE
ncbi:MAG: hypothetical protein V4619_03995 [Bacteroidota bacterium]